MEVQQIRELADGIMHRSGLGDWPLYVSYCCVKVDQLGMTQEVKHMKKSTLHSASRTLGSGSVPGCGKRLGARHTRGAPGPSSEAAR